MTVALVALGSNLGDRRQNLERAIELLAAKPRIRVVAVSSQHATRPIGGPPSQGEFLNAAILLETSHSPEKLLALLREIENSLGRKRDQHWAARSLDLDLLLFGDEVIDSPDLRVPHPRMQFRRFVLEPAAEVAPDMRHPIIGKTIIELVAYLRKSIDYIAIAGLPSDGKQLLAQATAQRVGGTYLADPAVDLFKGQLSRFGRIGARALVGVDQDTGAEEAAAARDRLIGETVVASGGATLISDFWCGEILRGPGAYTSYAISPKLLAWFNEPPSFEDIVSAEHSRQTELFLNGISAILKQQFEAAMIPLKLMLDNRLLQMAIDELSSTIQSMRG